MRRAKQILVIASVLSLGVSAAEARLWGSRNNAKAPESSAIAGVMALTAVQVDGSRVILQTTGAPAFTSYTPSPGVFVIDLTNTSRDAAAVVPATLPPAVVSISADEVVEMGSTLTRVTLRLSQPIRPEITTADKSVVIAIPATAIPIETASATPAEVLPAVTPVASAAELPETSATPVVEAPAPEISEPVAVAEDITLPRARAIRRIDASAADGGVTVRISADGSLKYKAFRLENPSRLVIDLDGVKNAVPKGAVTVQDEVVQRVRVAQFTSAPPVARVVIDLAHKSEYTINPVGDELRVSFGTAMANSAPAEPVRTAAVEPPPAPVRSPEPKVEPKPEPKMAAPADLPASVPVIAETQKTSWKVPQASKGAKSVINADQTTVAPAEDVFNQPPTTTTTTTTLTPSGGSIQTLGGTRTLSGGPRVFTGEPISLNLKDADIKDVIRTFAELTGLNIAVDPGVGGSVTVDFTDVPWDQALDLILRQNNLTFSLEGNVMRIGTLSRLAAETAETRKLAEEERLNVPLTTLSFKLSYARAIEVQKLLKDIASPRARIIVDIRTNQLIISEIPQFLQTMQNLIQTIDIPTRQVMIEARIVESSRTFSQSWGFEWGFNGDLDPALGTGTGLIFPNRIGYTGGPFSFTGGGKPVISLHLFDVLGAFNLDLALNAAEAQGYVKVVSAPRVTTQDNEAAEIQSGFQIPYQTRVNFTTTVQYLDATLKLSVTPQITEAGTVIMEINLQKNQPAVGLSIEGAAGTPLTTRQAKTRLMVRDGGTAVIAGLFQTQDNNSQTRLPFVHNIPVIGNLFKSHNITTSHDELLIFITPRIIRG